ncbi:formiminoglutamase [Rahnella sp. BIGb0603]|jgi:N-formylglutamate deformylase|uniref:N-formylglutamate deformylase n=1 Tax=Rahnella sp. BIGb0603 TaxID=2940612 RepID=UPI00216A5FCD|nr:N-formylglutamate deformylase [Rahnella sp. BIGb0603]MCS3422635.1 formiminoglutamase [Rahnella sp. BIGb0603]
MSLSAANRITDPYHFIPGTAPILISIPHAGTHLTPEVASGLSDAALPLSDTDWHIPKLYDFARALGASILVGQYSRFVIDLNRPSDDKPLYTTATTGLYPDTLFDGRATFKPGMMPTDAQRQQYLDEIWQPYHQKIQSELERMKQEFGYALLFDAHSIASVIPRLFDGQLPDLNLGTNSGESCAPELSEILEKTCQQQTRFTHVLNGRFKGGYITRAYGQPENDVHAVQLELAQVNYMEEIEPFSYSEDKASELQALLKPLLAGMVSWGSERYKQGAV